jgi:hypothetical protein
MFIFAAHDPGAKNHIRPIYLHALEAGEKATWIDLSTRSELMKWDHAHEYVVDNSIEILVTGSSICVKGGGIDHYQLPPNCEKPLIRACKNKKIPCISVVDLGIQGKFDKANFQEIPDRFLVTNSGCVSELLDLGVDYDSIVLTGSAHLETYANTKLKSGDVNVKRIYGLSRARNLISFFCGPDTAQSIEAVNSISSLLLETQLTDFTIVVRPHPRMPLKSLLEEQVRKFGHVLYDEGGEPDTLLLLAASRVSFSMASLVSLESLVIGTPSAFYQIGWDYENLNNMYNNVMSVPRVRTKEELGFFIDRLLESDRTAMSENIEFQKGALARSWKAILELL